MQPGALAALGQAHHAAGRFDAAAEAYGAAIAMTRAFLARLHYNRGTALDAAGRLDDAAAAYLQAVAYDPDLTLAVRNLGVIRQRQGRFEDAERAYRETLSGNPDDLEARFGLGALHCARGEADAAAACFQRIAARASDAETLARARGGLGAVEQLRGLAALHAGDDDAAISAFRRATELAPDQATPWTHLAMLAASRDEPDAEAAYRAALDRDPRHHGALHGLATLLRRSGRLDEAGAIYDRILAISPADEDAVHLRASVRDENPPAAPRAYPTSLFDDYAGRYDAHMIDRLAYRAPALLAAAVGDRDVAVALDLGCGTGLVGAAIRARVGELHGVDLSSAMIEEARRKQLYERLVVGDAIEELEAGDAPRFDLIVAGDVLVYVGALDRLFAAAARRLAPGGRFAFTVERGPDGDPGYRLRPTGRYVHGRDYVVRLAAAHDLALERCEAAPLRRELDAEVEGLVVVVSARSSRGSARASSAAGRRRRGRAPSGRRPAGPRCARRRAGRSRRRRRGRRRACRRRGGRRARGRPRPGARRSRGRRGRRRG